tara:strand:+ start:29465 stop:29827 length:363 start_codon:yes stop_codon:yes gene_type:complete
MFEIKQRKSIHCCDDGELLVDEGFLNDQFTLFVDVRELECPEHTMMLKLALRKYRSDAHQQVVFVTMAATIAKPTNLGMVEAQLDLEKIELKIENGSFDNASEDNPIWVLFKNTLFKQVA